MPISTLYKTLSPQQLIALQRSDYRELSADFAGQQNMYLKLHRSYAEMMARQWHLPLYGAAFIAQLRLPSTYLASFVMETLGYSEHYQYCIPLTQLTNVNDALSAKIVIVGGIVGHRQQRCAAPKPLLNLLELI